MKEVRKTALADKLVSWRTIPPELYVDMI